MSFKQSALASITFPSRLQVIDQSAFDGCAHLKTIYVEDGCGFKIPATGVLSSVSVGPPEEAKTGGARIWDLRKLGEIVIPDGVEKIGNHWFCGSDIQ